MAEWVGLVGGGRVGHGEGSGERDTGASPSQHCISVPVIALGNSKTQKGSLRGVKERETQRKAGT